MNSTTPHETYNLIDFITEGVDSEISVATTSYLLNINDTIITTSSIFDSYIDFIMPNTVLISLTDEEYEKYKFDPKLLSLELYGTMELWFLLLKINRCSSLFEFKSKLVRIIHPNELDVINKIINLNEERLVKSRQNLDIDYEYKI